MGKFVHNVVVVMVVVAATAISPTLPTFGFPD